VPAPKTVDDALHAKLTAATGVSSIVSTRIHPDRAPDGVAAPYIVFQLIYADQDQTLAGAAGLAEHLFQIDCYAKDAAKAKELAQRVVLALHGFQGSAGSVTIRALRANLGPSFFFEETKMYQRVVEARFTIEGPLS